MNIRLTRRQASAKAVLATAEVLGMRTTTGTGGHAVTGTVEQLAHWYNVLTVLSAIGGAPYHGLATKVGRRIAKGGDR